MYGRSIHIALGGTLEDACEYYKFDYDPDLKHCQGVCITEELGPTKKVHILIWFKDEVPKAGVIAHECFHATCAALRATGLSLSTKSEEAYAYYLDWLVDKVYKELE
jgi:hypothetical protein